MFFLALSAMIISIIVGTALLIGGKMLFGIMAFVIAGILFLFILVYYGKRKHRKKKFDCTPDCDCGPDLDCDCGPDCD
ncbi:hypothetical protein KHA94_24145 [Bacillus sp. FJAT-49705]|uniref:FeoB-associated Cys-rich membrane protein n=1 Tax=Cytobacillus citreus TaxID=2833586 RepID=A0ABS5P023_9BACI|nr:hypothetical protein [Cytobacillus citreus]MBS4193191.1 hypothetical protein [Cytobacillus citreus]